MHLAEKYVEMGKNYYPLWATWEVTSRCNAKCDYCYLGKSKNAIEDIDTDLMFEIADKIHASGSLFITITGGEPFIRKDILSILEYIIHKDFFSIILFSNGSLVNEEHLHFLSDNRKYFQNIQLSVFSHIPEVNDAYFGINGSLENTLHIGNKLLSIGIPVTLAFNLFDFNVKESGTTQRKFWDMGFSVRTAFYKLLLDQEHEQLLETNITKDFYKAFLENMDQSAIKKVQLRLAENNRPINQNDSFCNGVLTNIAIDSSGNILPCIAFRNLPLGSVLGNRTIHEILRSSSTLKKVRSIRRKDIKTCVHCKYLYECKFCLGMMHTRYNDLTKPLQQYCTYFKILENYQSPTI
jgi:radical SAM protein with 4Fe4S-binding SPASM domain